MAKPIIKAAKLAMEADGNIIGVSFIVSADKSLSDKLGTMFGIVEMYNANSGFADAFLEAIDDLRTEYYLPPHNLAKGVEKRFEEALARTNRRLQTAVTQSIEEVDLRNISAAVGILIDNQIYVASVGHLKGFFFRRKKNGELTIMDILAGDGDKHYRPEPEKIFANILNGELSDRDAIFLCNEEFLALFSQVELGEIALANPAAETAQFLDAALKEKVAKKNFYAIALRSDNLIEESPATEAKPAGSHQSQPEKHSTSGHSGAISAAASQSSIARSAARPAKPQSQDSLNQLLITQVRTEKYLSPSLLPNWQKALLLAGGQMKKAGKFISQKSAQAASAAKAKAEEIKAAQTQKAQRARVEAGSAAVSAPNEDADSVLDAELELEQRRELLAAEDETAKVLADDFNEQAELEEVPAAVAAAIRAHQAAKGENAAAAPIMAPQNDAAPRENYPRSDLVMPEIKNPAVTKPAKPALKIDRPAAIKPAAIKKDRWSETKLAAVINRWINSQIAKYFALKKSQQIVLIIGAALIFCFAQSVVIIGRSYDKTGSWPTSGNDDITKIESLLSSAEAQNIFNDEAGALSALREAQKLYNALPKRAYNKAARDSLLAKINATANLLEKINYLETPALTADFGGINLVGLAKTGNIFWSFDNSSQSLIRLDPASGQKTMVTTTMGSITKISAIDDKNLILLTASGSYFKYDLTKKTAAAVKPAKDYFKIKTVAPATPLVDPAIASSTITMSAVIDNYSFYLDAGNQRLVIFDKDGGLKRQFVSPSLANVSAFAASYKNKKVWLYGQGKVYNIDLDF